MAMWRPRAVGEANRTLTDDDRETIVQGLSGYGILADDVGGRVEVEFDVEAETEDDAIAWAREVLARLSPALGLSASPEWRIETPVVRITADA